MSYPTTNTSDQTQVPSDAGSDKRSSSLVSTIENVARTAWDSVKSVRDGLTGASDIDREHLPSISLAAEDKSKDGLWDSFGKEAKPGTEKNSWNFQSLKILAEKTGDTSGARSDNPATTAADATAKPADKTFDLATGLAWLEKGWNAIFGSSDNKNEPKAITKTDSQGNKSETKWGHGCIEHTDNGGTTRVDKSRAEHVAASGDKATMDKDSKTLSEVGVNGAHATLDKNGRYQVEDGQGNKLQWDHGHLIATSKDGTKTEVTDKEVIKQFREWSIKQHRQHGPHDRQGRKRDGKPCVETVSDDNDDAKQMIVIDDGKGTTINVHQDGRKEVKTGEGEQETSFLMKPGSKEILAVRGNEKAIMRRENGSWHVYDMDGKELTAGSGGLGGELAQSAKDGGVRLSGSTVVRGDGTLDSQNGTGNHLEVGPTSTTAVIRNANGEGKDVRIGVHGGTSTVQSNEPGGVQSTTVDTSNGAVKHQENKPDGTTQNLFNLDPGKTDYLTIGTKDGDICVHKDKDGRERVRLWNNDEFDTEGHSLDLNDGTKLDALNDAVIFDDGTWINALGDLYDESEFLVNEEEDIEAAIEATEAQAESLVSMAESVAARIASRQGDATLGDVGELLALYSQLGGLKVQAASLGDLSSYTKLDATQSVTSAAINQAHVQLAQQTILKSLANISPTVLAQVHNLMPHSVIPQGITKVLEESGILPKSC